MLINHREFSLAFCSILCFFFENINRYDKNSSRSLISRQNVLLERRYYQQIVEFIIVFFERNFSLIINHQIDFIISYVLIQQQIISFFNFCLRVHDREHDRINVLLIFFHVFFVDIFFFLLISQRYKSSYFSIFIFSNRYQFFYVFISSLVSTSIDSNRFSFLFIFDHENFFSYQTLYFFVRFRYENEKNDASHEFLFIFHESSRSKQIFFAFSSSKSSNRIRSKFTTISNDLKFSFSRKRKLNLHVFNFIKFENDNDFVFDFILKSRKEKKRKKTFFCEKSRTTRSSFLSKNDFEFAFFSISTSNYCAI